jgi:hypothetical protein
MALYMRGAFATDTCATNGDPCPLVNASATFFFSVSLPCEATPNWFMS